MWDDVGYAGVGIESWYVLVPALALWGAVLVTRAVRGRPGWTGRHLVLRAVVGAYVAGVVHFTLFPVDVQWGAYADRTAWYAQVNWVPLLTADLPSFALNVVMLVPFGVLLPLVSARAAGAGRVAVWSLAFSVSIEVTQLLVYVVAGSGRSVDVNDLLANALGGVLGYLLGRSLPALRRGALPGSAYA
ncbi:VanZ family protein [Saccharothrix longispora]|uniref:VanZ family protein n=1 Tax=Saccharothrix longispora TaxID=33920 RepID=UPI0028FD6366|nr:VanZ family protein [Saccharothrix longispora]MDU0294858.1 VanZ family protein [Saccharothrix longispora]